MEVNIEINKATKQKRKMGSKKKIQDVLREQKSLFLFFILPNLMILNYLSKKLPRWDRQNFTVRHYAVSVII